LNTLPDDGDRDRRWLAGLARAWSEAGFSVIHHELAEFPTLARLHHAVRLIPAASIGLSLSELYTLVGRRADPGVLAQQVVRHYGARRVIVHADRWALSVHQGDPEHQERVLLAGNALAAARARNGRPTAILDPTEEATYTDDLPLSHALADWWRVTLMTLAEIRQCCSLKAAA
jgi:hypothetical protein